MPARLRRSSAGDGGQVTWRLIVPPGWGTRGGPAWLPATNADSWRRVFEAEDMAGHMLREQSGSLPWRVAAKSSALLASVLAQYRIQLRVAEDEAARGEHGAAHLAALAAAEQGAQPPSRSHPPGPWQVRSWEDGCAIVVARHPSVDGAEGDAAAHWAEPVVAGPRPRSSD